jgi:hypothetical protein
MIKFPQIDSEKVALIAIASMVIAGLIASTISDISNDNMRAAIMTECLKNNPLPDCVELLKSGL